MKLVPLSDIFDIIYGNQLDFNKMVVDDESPVNFICRSSANLGVMAKVKRLKINPFEAGHITVTLGGTYLLSCFVQPAPFYTAQNIKVLSAKDKGMSFWQKLFYCKCIAANRFKYSSHGREANRSLDTLFVPAYSEVPDWVNEMGDIESHSSYRLDPLSEIPIDLNGKEWAWFPYCQLFDIERGKGARKKDIVEDGTTPFITSVEFNNGLIGYVNDEPKHKGNVLTVNRNGSVGEAFYQLIPFCSTEDVHVFNPKFSLNPFIAIFLLPLIKMEKFRYSYGRKWGLERMRNSTIKLPVDPEGKPDWSFMESFVRSLPFSSNIIG